MSGLFRFGYVIAFLVRPGEPAGPLVLVDQYEHTWNLNDARGSLVVMIDGDRDGNKFNNVWARAVRSRYKDQVKIVYVAHLSAVPGFMHGFVKGKFISKDPSRPNGPVLLDWKGAVAHQFGFRENVANVYVIDREGVLRYTGSGQGTPSEIEPLLSVIDRLLAAVS